MTQITHELTHESVTCGPCAGLPLQSAPTTCLFLAHTVPTPQPHAPRSARRKLARPGELLDAALELFVSQGYARTRVEEIARRAGVSKGTLFLYFPSKDELFKALIRNKLAGRLTAWREEFERASGPTAELLRLALRRWWQDVGCTPAGGISKLMLSEAQHFPELAAFYQREVVQPGNALIARILQRGIASGEFRPIDLRYGVYLVVAPMMFLNLWRHSLGHCASTADGELDPETYLEHQADMLLDGLRAPPGGVPPTPLPHRSAL